MVKTMPPTMSTCSQVGGKGEAPLEKYCTLQNKVTIVLMHLSTSLPLKNILPTWKVPSSPSELFSDYGHDVRQLRKTGTFSDPLPISKFCFEICYNLNNMLHYDKFQQMVPRT